MSYGVCLYLQIVGKRSFFDVFYVGYNISVNQKRILLRGDLMAWRQKGFALNILSLMSVFAFSMFGLGLDCLVSRTTIGVMYYYTCLNFQITRLDIRPRIKWAVSLVIACMVTLIFLNVCVGMYGLTHSLYHSRGFTFYMSVALTVISLLCKITYLSLENAKRFVTRSKIVLGSFQFYFSISWTTNLLLFLSFNIF